MVKLVKKLGHQPCQATATMKGLFLNCSYSCGGLGWSLGPSMERVLVISYAGLFSREGIQTFPHHHSKSCQAQHSSSDTLLYQSREIHPSMHTQKKHMDINPSLCMQNPSWFVFGYSLRVDGSLGKIIPTNYQESLFLLAQVSHKSKPSRRGFPKHFSNCSSSCSNFC